MCASPFFTLSCYQKRNTKEFTKDKDKCLVNFMLHPIFASDFFRLVKQRMKRKCLLIIILSALCGHFAATAQNFAVKTNLLADAALSPDIGIEAALAPRWTLDLHGSYNPWTLEGERKWKHWMVQPELRFWSCQRFNGLFFGVHAQGGVYNVGNLPFSPLDENRYEGWFIGAGAGMGYQWILSRYLNLEIEAGGGYNYSRYNRYRCGSCGQKLEEDQPYHYWGITKATLSILYLF